MNPVLHALLVCYCLFLFLFPIVLILREKKRRMTKLLGYLAVPVFLAVAIPQYAQPSARYLGKMMAREWVEHGQEARFPGLRFKAINEAEAIVSSAEPPVLLFISARKEYPHCIGQPESAEQACQKTLESLILRRPAHGNFPDPSSPDNLWSARNPAPGAD